MPSCNDMVLLITLAYSALDIRSEWATFTTCRKPVHQWLLTSYAFVIAFRVLHSIGTQSSNIEGEFLVNLRLKGTMPQLMMLATWLVVMPGFSVWTVTGTFWTWEVWSHSPQCLPSQFLWFSMLWQVVSFFWIVAHFVLGFVALSREWNLRRTEADLRALEDPDTVSRWGAVSQLQSGTSGFGETRVSNRHRPGLSPAQIGALSGLRLHTSDCQSCASEECPICLAEFHDFETLRQLPNCVHSFHKSCIDLWLLQSASCPLCKVEVPRHAPAVISRRSLSKKSALEGMSFYV